MADIAITAANVVPGGDATIDRGGFAGVAITAGQVVYREAATGLIKLADADVAAAQVPLGIALNSASIGQPVAVQTGGSITIGGTLVAATAYYLSDTAGGIRTTPDTGDLVVLLGLAASTTALNLRIVNSGVTL